MGQIGRVDPPSPKRYGEAQTAERLPVYRCAFSQIILFVFRRRRWIAMNRDPYGLGPRRLQLTVMRAAEKQKRKRMWCVAFYKQVTPLEFWKLFTINLTAQPGPAQAFVTAAVTLL